MVDFELTKDENGRIYFPKELCKILDGKKIIAVPNRVTILLHADGADTDMVIGSAEVLLQELKLKRQNEINKK